MKLGKKVTGTCDLCIKKREGTVTTVNGIPGLKLLTLCIDHIDRLSDLVVEEESRPTNEYAKAN